MKLPVSTPSLVLLFEVVGCVVVLQQIPRAVSLAPPSLVTSPPPVALVNFTELILLVEIAGKTGGSFFLQLNVNNRAPAKTE